MKVVFVAPILVAVFVMYPSVCHGLPTPEADPYRHETVKDNRQAVTGRQMAQPATKSYGSELRYSQQNDKRRPPYKKPFYAAYGKKQSGHKKEEDSYVILLEQVPKQTPYDPIPYAVYFQVTADGIDVDDSAMSY